MRKEYRSASILLLKPLLAMRDTTVVNLTPTVRSYEIFKKLGFKALETEQLLMAPIANSFTLPGGTYTTDPSEFERHLSEPERAIHRGLATSPSVVHLMLRRGGKHCYLVATVKRIKRIPMAELHYIGDPDFFWENRALAHVAVLRAMGAVGLFVDARFAQGRRVGFTRRLPAKRLYRPARPDIPPGAIDGLFSELMVLKI
ncbi:MAG: hypothetical protein IAI50_04095 [Candidatus Eremiobacteraeota bacterium]|nr:hypothetical protein [Candidatus Eremiobacteraeota bacterium]